MSAASWLRRNMEIKQLTQQDVEKLSGVRQQNISDILNGKTKNHSWKTARKLASAFHCKPQETYGE